MKIDNFSLMLHQECPTKYNKRIRQGWTVRGRSAALGFGGSVHLGLAEWYRTHDLQAAKDVMVAKWEPGPPEDYRNLNKALEVIEDYVKEYPDENFDVIGFGTPAAMVERTFTLPTGLYLPCPNHPDFTGSWFAADEPLCRICNTPREQIEYGGIFDTLVTVTGKIYILEHKTTSVMTGGFFRQFKPNNQITGYVWAGSVLHGKVVAGAIVNAIATKAKGATQFEREITSRNEFEINEWKRNLWISCIEIKHNERNDLWPMRTGSCVGKYGACMFHDVCSVNSPEYRQKRLEQDYIHDPWSYEERD